VLAQPATRHGRPALRAERSSEVVAAWDCVDPITFVVLPVDFGGGGLALDLLGKRRPTAPDYARGCVGVAFRVAPDGHVARGALSAPYQRARRRPVRRRRAGRHAVRYFAYPDRTFTRLRAETPGVYEAAADVGPDEWLHVRLAAARSGAVARGRHDAGRAHHGGDRHQHALRLPGGAPHLAGHPQVE
jgi:hypothetical protein